jgi:protein O-mannosyl-transferase
VTPPSPPRHRLPTAAALGLPLLATLLLYLGGLGGELVYDDLNMVGRNPWIADLANLPEILTSPYWDFMEPEESQQIGYWRPLTGAAHAISWAIGDGATWVFHAMGLIVHLGAVAVSFFLARRLTKNLSIAAFTALVFGLHPVHVESVAWISALNDPLFGLFALLAIGAHLRWREGGSRGFSLVAPLCFALALASKELGIAVLPLVAAIDLGRRPTSGESPDDPWSGFRRPIHAFAPLLAVLLLYVGARMLVFGSPAAGFDRITTDFGVGFARLASLRLEVLGGSLELLAWPIDLRLFRPFRPTLPWSDPDLLRALAWTVVTAGAILWAWRRGKGAALIALLIIPAGLLPVLIRMQSLGSFPLSDRFLYLPVFGFGLGLCLLAFRLLPRSIATISLLIVCGLYTVKSHERIGTWQSESDLFTAAARETPRNPVVLWGLGRVLLGRAKTTQDRLLLEETIAVYERAARLLGEAKQPDTDLFVSSRDYLQVNLGLGWCYVLLAQIDRGEGFGTALAIFEQLATRIEEIYEETRQAEALGMRTRTENLELEQVYTALGATHHFAGDLEKAEKALRRALAINADYPEAHQNLGRIYHEQEQWLVARRHFEFALAQRPRHLEDRLLIADCYFSEGNAGEAERIVRELLEEYPEEPAPMVVLATTAMERHDWGEALRWLDRALVVDPDHGYAWYKKATVLLLRDGQKALDVTEGGREVLEAFRTAVRRLPDNFEAHYQFAAYLLMAGATEPAMPILTRAYALCEDDALLLLLRQNFAGLPSPTADLFSDLASIDQGRGELNLAESWLDAALTLDPEHGEALLRKARLLGRRGRDAEALAMLRLAAAALPDSYEVQTELGALLAKQGLLREAVEVFEQAMGLGPPRGWSEEMVNSSRARIREKIGELRAVLDTPGPPARSPGNPIGPGSPAGGG